LDGYWYLWFNKNDWFQKWKLANSLIAYILLLKFFVCHGSNLSLSLVTHDDSYVRYIEFRLSSFFQLRCNFMQRKKAGFLSTLQSKQRKALDIVECYWLVFARLFLEFWMSCFFSITPEFVWIRLSDITFACIHYNNLLSVTYAWKNAKHIHVL